jgi:hypothetical protein
MSTNILISKDNIENVLKPIVTQLYSQINALDLSAADKAKLTILNYIVTTGDGTKFLSNDGTYKFIDISSLSSMSEKIGVIYSIFNISGSSYTLTLPSDIQAKVDALVTTGTGSKVLSDNGTYVDLQSLLVTTLTTTEENTMISDIVALL